MRRNIFIAPIVNSSGHKNGPRAVRKIICQAVVTFESLAEPPPTRKAMPPISNTNIAKTTQALNSRTASMLINIPITRRAHRLYFSGLVVLVASYSLANMI